MSSSNQIRSRRNKPSLSNWLESKLYNQAFDESILHHLAISQEGSAQRRAFTASAAVQQVSDIECHPAARDLKVGIVGAGFAGLFSGIILQSLGIDYEIFESSNRPGGRIHTWYSNEYHPTGPNNSLYGEMGGMRLPQFAEDMLPVQQLALAVNTVLGRNGFHSDKIWWRKFYYNSPISPLRYNNMLGPYTAEHLSRNPQDVANLQFGQASQGDVPDVWLAVHYTNAAQGQPYVPANVVIDQINAPFMIALDKDFANGYNELMKYDGYSTFGYLINVFTLGQLGEYYSEDLGDKDDHLPYAVAKYLETMNVGTGMYACSFTEMVLVAYDWDGAKDPYLGPCNKNANDIFMLTVDNGMQHFPNACLKLANLVGDSVTPEDGHNAQIDIGMAAAPGHEKTYNPNNLTPDAWPNTRNEATLRKDPVTTNPHPHTTNRVKFQHKVVQMRKEPTGVRVDVVNTHAPDQIEQHHYSYVISTIPNGAYSNGRPKESMLQDCKPRKYDVIRQSNYMSSFKAFLVFDEQFWITPSVREHKQFGGLGVSDFPARQIVYPSYGYDNQKGVLQIYCWAADAEKMGSLTHVERINECLKLIQFLHPTVNVEAHFSGRNLPNLGEETWSKSWFWDQQSYGGAFAMFSPGQFNNIYNALLEPDYNNRLWFAGECCSVHHGWIVGALNSAKNAILGILRDLRREDLIEQMNYTWGKLTYPDVAP